MEDPVPGGFSPAYNQAKDMAYDGLISNTNVSRLLAVDTTSRAKNHGGAPVNDKAEYWLCLSDN
jgi:hypothetical protein